MFQMFIEINITALRGYKCIFCWLVKLITEFLAFQKAIQTIFISFENSTLHFDKLFWQNWEFWKNSFCTKIDVNLNSDVLQKPTIAHQKASSVFFWQIKQKCESLSVKVALVKSVYNTFLTKMRILQKLILH